MFLKLHFYIYLHNTSGVCLFILLQILPLCWKPIVSHIFLDDYM